MTQVTSRRDPLTQRFARTLDQTRQDGYGWWQAAEPEHIPGAPPRPIFVSPPWWRRVWRWIFGR